MSALLLSPVDRVFLAAVRVHAPVDRVFLAAGRFGPPEPSTPEEKLIHYAGGRPLDASTAGAAA